MKRSLVFLTVLVAVTGAARAQVAPEATGPGGPLVSGSVNYDVSFSQNAMVNGGTEGNTMRSVLSGDLKYTSPSENRPLNVTYSGGDMWAESGYSAGTGVFQHMLISQGFEGRNWGSSLSDDVSYLPQSPTTGFSGIPGIGSIPGLPEPPDQPILTNARSLHNTSSANFSHNVNYAGRLSLGGSYSLLRFPDSGGLETNSLQLQPQYTRRLNPLNSLTAGYVYSLFSYVGSSFSMTTMAATFGLDRTWNRKFKTSFDAGPEWTSSSNDAVLPPSTGVRIDGKATYELKSASANLAYNQSTTSGSIGTLLATRNEDATAGLSKDLGRDMSIGASASYRRTQQLLTPGVVNSAFAGVNFTRRIGQFISCSASYTAIHQLSSIALPTSALLGLSQDFSFSISYSPRERHLKKQ